MWICQGSRPLVGLGLSCWLGMCCSPWGELLLWEEAVESFGGVPWTPREKMCGGGLGLYLLGDAHVSHGCPGGIS